MNSVNPWVRDTAIAVLLGVHAGSLTAAPATAPTALHVVAKPATTPTKNPKGRVVSPYARAAAANKSNGQLAAGHAPTRVQGMGRPRKPHSGGAT